MFYLHTFTIHFSIKDAVSGEQIKNMCCAHLKRKTQIEIEIELMVEKIAVKDLFPTFRSN